ncbi:MAG: GTPase, partial [Acidimicrobiia bacterium]|nr:GTPase [Acidimicrobiia bacterium]
MKARRVVILGAAGRDFHVFNTVYRDDPASDVRAFTATQIPEIADRRYPAELAGDRYPDGIPIVDEDDLERLIIDERIHEVAFAYSDVTHEHVMHLASRALAGGPDFVMHGPLSTQLPSVLPVISITAVRTGCGKSQISRWLSGHLRRQGKSVAALRHPMPYGDLRLGRVQRFGSVDDIDAADCTAEEREEYEPHVSAGNVVFAGVDYGAVLEAAEAEAEILIWDGGNNDFSFVRPDLSIVVVDALRPDHLETHHPGEMVLRSADVVVVNKVDAATSDQIATALAGVRRVAPGATITRAASPITLAHPEMVRNKRVLVVEDGPTTTHGGMASGAGLIAALAAGADAIVDPRKSAAPLISDVYAEYPHLGPVLPAVGYFPDQLAALETTINDSDAEVVVAGTPIDLAALVTVNIPVLRA